MAIVNLSLDTGSRQIALTVNGVIVPCSDCWLEKYSYDGEEYIRFTYSVETTDTNGMKERRQYYLPTPEELATEAHAGLNEDGFASKIVHDDKQAQADMIDYLAKLRKQ